MKKQSTREPLIVTINSERKVLLMDAHTPIIVKIVVYHPINYGDYLLIGFSVAVNVFTFKTLKANLSIKVGTEYPNCAVPIFCPVYNINLPFKACISLSCWVTVCHCVTCIHRFKWNMTNTLALALFIKCCI